MARPQCWRAERTKPIMQSQDIFFDVTEATGLDEPVKVAGSLHLPDDADSRKSLPLLLCLHGGGYRRAYWNPPFADESYSFARYFTERGRAVLALDHLGMGDSSKPARESKLSRARIAAANAHALAETVAGLKDGRFASAQDVPVTGIGHSIGGMMIITQAAAHGGMDRVASLGWANQAMTLFDADPAAMAAAMPEEGYAPSPRQAMRALFYLPDVPLSLIEADEAHGDSTPTCLGRDALTPGIVHEASACIAAPVFVLHAIIDTSPDPIGEAAFFKASKDITVSVLDGAAHCHNFASSRREHWRRLDAWIDSTST